VSDNGKAPTRSTLKGLAGMLPSFTKGFIERRVTGKGRPIEKPATQYPAQFCAICGVVHVTTTDEKAIPVPENCQKCRDKLAAGFTAFTDGKEVIWAKSERLKDMAGTVQILQPLTFGRLKEHYRQEWETNESNKSSSQGA
jgi:hypothetical protein